MLTIYCAKPAAVTADELRSIASGAKDVAIDSGGTATVTWAGCRLKINTMPAGEVDAHLRGLVGFLTAHGTSGELIERARAVKQVLGIVLEDDFDDASFVWEVVEGLASHRRGFVFAPDGIFEVDGTPLLPFHLALDDDSDDELAGGAASWQDDDLDDEDWDAEPPTPERVARRALALAAVVLRAHLELGTSESDPAAKQAALLAWLEHHDIASELEPAERELLESPLGKADQRQVIEASWRAEGLVVLAWALGEAELPAHDEMCDPAQVAADLGLLADDTPEILVNPTLKPEERLTWLQDRLLGIHWRLVDYRVDPRSMNFREFAADCWFGSFDLDGVALVRDDLAINGQAIHAAPDEAVASAESIAVERHQAINWLLGWDPIYSEVDTST